MFTGLVEKIGTVSVVNDLDTSESGGDGLAVTISDCGAILGDVHLGDSICTNGVCLTVTEFDENRTWFKVGIAPETVRRSNLGDLKVGSQVNLERAVTSDVRLGGHVVQGHVDTIAAITKKEADGNAISFTFQLRDPEYVAYIVEKGFISVDGTSLTVTEVEPEHARFSIMMVSYTQGKVVMPFKDVGDTVNVEVDLTGKLIESSIEAQLARQIQNEESPLVKLIGQIVERKVAEVLSRAV